MEILVTSTCYFLINQHFKKYGCDETVKKMQVKVSKGLLLELLVEIFMTAAYSVACVCKRFIHFHVHNIEKEKTIFLTTVVSCAAYAHIEKRCISLERILFLDSDNSDSINPGRNRKAYSL
ncbi:hypothetical protein Y032_0055g2589 [Ancylostoma ceylanicum]|uniref:Uncharacterized protein n=1 Tax=Ancylostoma ceylanicum TaxID=53326 RepID=A0A016U6P3_9BILA|nr:hypothetical protein Y032_0055g2589 [Ancylostoma ceylanicum]